MRAEAGTWFIRGAGFMLGMGLVVVIALIAVRALDVVLLVFLAVLLGAALEPVIGSIRGRTGMGRGLGILLVYAGFLALVILLVAVIVPAATVQFSAAVSRLPTFLETVRGVTAGWHPRVLADGIGASIDAAEAALKPGPPPDPTTVVNASVGVVEGLGAVVTLLVLVFFWLTERSRLQWYALAFMPMARRAGLRDGWNEVEARLGQWARGQLILMAALGLATGIAYSILGLPGALLLALIAAIAEIVPIAGPLIGAVPALLVATTISPQIALITLGIYAALQLLEGNVLVPMVMRNTVGLSPFLVLVSLLVGWTAGGPLAAIVAVPLVAGIEVALERLQDRESPVPIEAGPEGTPGEGSEEEAAKNAGAERAEPAELSSAPDAPGPSRRRARSASRAR